MRRIGFFLLISSILASPIALAKKEPSTDGKNIWVKKYSNIDFNSEISLKEALKLDGPLTPLFSLKLASLEIQRQNYHEALNLLKKMEESPWGFWKQVLLAKAYLGLKASHEALQLLETLPPEPEVDFNSNQSFYREIYGEALETKKEALEQFGKNSQEVSKRLWALFPDLREDLEKAPLLAALSPPNVPPPGVQMAVIDLEDKISRLHVLHAKKQYDDIPLFISVDEISGANLPLEKKCQAYYELGNSLRSLKREPEALNSYSKAVIQSCEGDFLSRSLYWKAKLEAKLDLPQEAIDTYQFFVKKFPRHRLTDDAYYFLWKLTLKIKGEKEANKAFEDLLHFANGDMRGEALWETAYAHFKEGRYQKAISQFDLILAKGPTEEEFYPQALYWKARSLEKQALSQEQAKAFYRKVREEFPFSFYAVLASHRLELPPHAVSIPPLKAKEVPLDQGAQESIAAINLLNDLGAYGEAQKALDYFSQENFQRREELKPLLAQKWMESGDYNQALAMSFKHFDVGPSEGVLKKEDPMFLALYPLAYPYYVKEGAKKAGLPQGVIQGIMREESLFQPAIKSWAGAVGVMQLMPATARMQASQIDLSGFSLDQLADPRTNILLGSTFFSKVLKSYEGHIPLTIMAYNAGPGNVNKWLRSRGHLPLDEFIEEIPFSETRGYVKRVLRSTQIYGSLLKEPQLTRPFFSMKLP